MKADLAVLARFGLGLFLALLLWGCAQQPVEVPPPSAPQQPPAVGEQLLLAPLTATEKATLLTPLAPAVTIGHFADAMQQSCSLWQQGKGAAGPQHLRPDPAEMVPACQALADLGGADLGATTYAGLVSWLDTYFTPYGLVAADPATGNQRRNGLFTGYFEASLAGASAPDTQYRYPIYGLPDDLLTLNPADFGLAAASGDQKPVLAARQLGQKLQPYPNRGEIARQGLAGKAKILYWANDALDLFLLHVQGSGRLLLPDGSMVRLGYAGNNGWGYQSIGRALIAQGALPPGQAGWPQIRRWLDQNPAEQDNLLAANPRYIFFRELEGIAPNLGPLGSMGVPLTPEHSLAVDPAYLAYGLPIMIDVAAPPLPKGADASAPDQQAGRLQRWMVAQDSGSAIKGPIRGDFFWGFGPQALARAGVMQSQGQAIIWLPKAVAARLPAQYLLPAAPG